MTDPAALLAAYDEQLRIETVTAESVTRHGPLHLATYAHGRGHVTYRNLDDGDPDELVDAALAHFTSDPDIRRVEWKARGHDHAPGLHEVLISRGFLPGEPESIMIGETRLLAVDVPLPDGVRLRRITAYDDVRAMCVMQDEVYAEDQAEEFTYALMKRLGLDDGMELWIAETETGPAGAGRIVSAGRLEPVAGSDFAGIWGGMTRPEWRGRGIYRALTAARARSALAMGRSLVQSDSTEFSRPILERAGLVRVSSTTPYEWRRVD